MLMSPLIHKTRALKSEFYNDVVNTDIWAARGEHEGGLKK